MIAWNFLSGAHDVSRGVGNIGVMVSNMALGIDQETHDDHGLLSFFDFAQYLIKLNISVH